MPAPRSARGGGRRHAGRRGPDAPVPGSAADLTPDADPDAVARAICLRQLTMGPRSRGQLREALARRDVPEDAAQRVLDRLTEVGLVDDEAFAEGLVRSRHAVRGLGRRALSQELRRRGVDDETAAHAVDGLDPDEERATALRLARRKLAATRGLDREVRVRRTAGMLARKGYAGGLVAAVVREALGEEAGTADELTAADRLLGGHEV